MSAALFWTHATRQSLHWHIEVSSSNFAKHSLKIRFFDLLGKSYKMLQHLDMLGTIDFVDLS